MMLRTVAFTGNLFEGTMTASLGPGTQSACRSGGSYLDTGPLELGHRSKVATAWLSMAVEVRCVRHDPISNLLDSAYVYLTAISISLDPERKCEHERSVSVLVSGVFPDQDFYHIDECPARA